MKNTAFYAFMAAGAICLSLSGCSAAPQEQIQEIENFASDTINVYNELALEYANINNSPAATESSSPIKNNIYKFIHNWNSFDEQGFHYLLENSVSGNIPEVKNSFDTAYETFLETGELTKVSLIRVVDGDTLYVELNGDFTYIRLIGINTPESVHPDSALNTEEGITVSNYTKQILLSVDSVYLEFDINEYDEYGRVLAYVWLDTNTSDINNMLNAQLLKSGAAQVMTIEPNVKYSTEFSKINNCN